MQRQDKVVLKLFATTVDAGKLEKALDLVYKLEHEKSYDIAMQIAERHNKLVDYIEEAKEAKFGGSYEDDEEVDDHYGDMNYEDRNSRFGNQSSPPKTRPESSRKISPEANASWKSKRALEEPRMRQERSVKAKTY